MIGVEGVFHGISLPARRAVYDAPQGSAPPPSTEPAVDAGVEPPGEVEAPPAQSGWHPVRVRRDAAGWPHFFEVYDKKSGKNVPRVLIGYRAIGMGGDSVEQSLDSFVENGANFVRLWLGASYGYYAYAYDGVSKVDLDSWNDAFFRRLDDILSAAEARGVVVVVMMWDR